MQVCQFTKTWTSHYICCLSKIWKEMAHLCFLVPQKLVLLFNFQDILHVVEVNIESTFTYISKYFRHIYQSYLILHKRRTIKLN